MIKLNLSNLTQPTAQPSLKPIDASASASASASVNPNNGTAIATPQMQQALQALQATPRLQFKLPQSPRAMVAIDRIHSKVCRRL